MQDLLDKASVTSSYDLFASTYDHFFAPEALDATVRALDSLLLKDLLPGSDILDLCCGSGRLSEVLIERGYHVTGIDNSLEMLGRAHARVPGAKFFSADIRYLDLKPSFDAVICAYNSLPHITASEDLTKVFHGVRRCLRPGGVFMFDLFSPAAYAQRWRGCFARVEADRVCLVQARYDPVSAVGENDITIFQHDRDWKRFDLKLTTRCYRDEELRPMLADAGFRTAEKFEHTDQNLAGRVFWRCVALT